VVEVIGGNWAPTTDTAPTSLVAGLDGCRAGWVAVTVPLVGGGPVDVQVLTDLGDLLADLEAGRILAAAIDIPIGLPNKGPRSADVEARRRLGPRRSSVFPAPVRAVLGATTYQEACERSLAACGKAISKQLFNIVPKIRQVDALQSPGVQRRLVEMHPELSFSVLAGQPMSHSKATAVGVAERVRALSAVFGDVERHATHPPVGSKVDDVLDAFVGAWTATRYAAGTHQTLGGELDAVGLRMEMVA
jgi:predicted RNase H-like nuclease